MKNEELEIQSFDNLIAARIVADTSDKSNACTHARSRDGLICSFSADTGLKCLALNRFAGMRHEFAANQIIGIRPADHHNVPFREVCHNHSCL
jgi:hypothetical protein